MQAVLFGGFASYLSTSEVVYREVFDRESLFPLLFGGMAGIMGLATLVNGRMVERIGLRRMLRIDLTGYLIGAVSLLAVALVTGGRPPLVVYVLVLGLLLSSHAVLIPNLNARAMEPMGDIAGTASAINGSVLIGIGASIGALIDRTYDGTILPLAVAMLLIGLASAALLRRSERDVGRDVARDVARDVSGTDDRSRDRRPGPPRADRAASPRDPS
jgi:DHA1 family bicyclomycin/chloramphenicol resistance-like MFS transporter